MKTHVLFLAVSLVASLAAATVVQAQNDPAPAPLGTPTNAPAVPIGVTLTNAPAVEVKPGVDSAVLPSTAMVTNAPVVEGLRTNAGSEVVPLIVIDDVPLVDAVKNLARQAGLNYLPDPKLLSLSNQPNVTLRLENQTAQDALMAVIDTYNLQIINDPRSKIARITVKDPKAEDPLFSHIIQLKYTQPTNIVDIIKKSISPRGNVMGDARTSQLIVISTEKEFPAVEEMVARLDTPSRQVLIEAQLWETSQNPRSVKGIDWSGTLAAQNVSYGNGRVVAPSRTETIRPGVPQTITTPGGGSTTIQPKSTTIENTVYDPTRGGITLDNVKGFHPSTAFLNADGLNAVIHFFNTDNDTEVVATPRAVTLDNMPATLSVTRAFPIFKITPGSQNSPAGSEVTYTNLGTILNVTPHITANSNISLKVIPEVSDVAFVDRQIINGLANSANVYAIRRMETHVMIPSGNTLVLGGLISDATKNSINKVPIFGDIPGLGALFRKSDKSRDKANLVVFITPTIVGDYDYQLAESEFLQTKAPKPRESKESFMDSAKPYDWTKPKSDSSTAAK